MTKPKGAVAEVEEAQDLDLLEQLGELGTGTTIQVYREPGRQFLETVEPDAIAPENLKLLYGGGSYSLRARKDGTWAKGAKMVRVQIAGDPRPGSPGQPPAGSLTPAPVVHPPGTIEARLATLEGSTAADPASAMMQMMTALIVPVLTTALQRQPESSAVEILGIARELAQDQRDAASAAQVSDSDPIRDLGIPLLNVIQQGLPSGQPPPRQLTPGPPEKDEKPPTALQLAARIGAWCEPLERRDADPAMRAWCFLEDMEDSPYMAGVLDLIALPDVLDLWAGVSPRVAEKREWYASFVDELRRLTRPDPDAEDPPRNNGDPDHAPANGEVGPERQPDVGGPGARA